jgi:hypothetical protein
MALWPAPPSCSLRPSDAVHLHSALLLSPTTHPLPVLLLSHSTFQPTLPYSIVLPTSLSQAPPLSPFKLRVPPSFRSSSSSPCCFENTFCFSIQRFPNNYCTISVQRSLVQTRYQTFCSEQNKMLGKFNQFFLLLLATARQPPLPLFVSRLWNAFTNE